MPLLYRSDKAIGRIVMGREGDGEVRIIERGRGKDDDV